MADREKAAGTHVCPWWYAYTFDNALRRLIHDPRAILSPYVDEGMTVLDTGCGMGHFTIGMARLVGESGKVVAVDLQQKMLDVMMKRAGKAGLGERIVPRLCGPHALGLQDNFNFVCSFWMVHEVPDAGNFFREIYEHLLPGGCLLYTEPAFHVGEKAYRTMLAEAREQGFVRCAVPEVRFSRAVLLRRD
jgi:ubiquinone/menaquinone biosynthesis C-methylase UbiE